MLRVFIGCDDVEMLAYHVLADSIMRHASQPVSITPIRLSNLKDCYHRVQDPRQSNEFSFSRFLVPHLCNYEGFAVFMDCDMLVRCDINELYFLCNDEYDVRCVQHEYEPPNEIKYLGKKQHSYPCKNWSSVMLFNCKECYRLTPEYIAKAEPAWLHRMNWAKSVGRLPIEWNWLVGEYDYNPDARLLHWTVGGPWFKEFEDTDYADEWYAAMRLACNIEQPSAKLLQR